MIRVRTGSVYHYGIFVSEDEVIQFGPPPVTPLAGSTADNRVMATDIQEFSCGAIVEVAAPETREERHRLSPKKAVAAARAKLGQGGYDLLRNNCEHFAYQCVYGVGRSTQAEEVRRRWLSRPVVNVYILPIGGATAPEPVFPPQRWAEICQAADGLNIQKYAAWKALELGLAHAFGAKMEDLRFQKDAAGKWICQEYGISLAHTAHAVAAAVSNGPVGVDLECLTAFEERSGAREGLWQLAFTPQELERYPQGDGLTFLRQWTRKESIFKCRGGGPFVPGQTDGDGPDLRTECFELEGQSMVLSVCSPKAESLGCYLLGGDRPCRIGTKKI